MSRDPTFAGDKIQGKRDYQEDSFAFADGAQLGDRSGGRVLAILADGMGGHEGGATASQLVVDLFLRTYVHASGTTGQRLDEATNGANGRLKEEKERQPELSSMGCTLVGVMLDDGALEWISVGDSPLWLYRDGDLIRLNEDHSLAPIFVEQARQGKMDIEKALNHPDRGVLRSAVTGADIPMVDRSSEPVAVKPGDRIILASDGIEALSESEISSIVAEQIDAKPSVVVAELLRAVAEKDLEGQDNTTILVIRPRVHRTKKIKRFLGFVLIGAGVALVLLAVIARMTGLLDRDDSGGKPTPASTPETTKDDSKGKAGAPGPSAKPPTEPGVKETSPKTKVPDKGVKNKKGAGTAPSNQAGKPKTSKEAGAPITSPPAPEKKNDER